MKTCKKCPSKPKLDKFKEKTFGSKIPKKDIPPCFECSRYWPDLHGKD